MSSDLRIPTPANHPRYHEYAAGSPGDDRPLSERFADRMVTEHGIEATQAVLAALAQAFTAGCTCEAETEGTMR